MSELPEDTGNPEDELIKKHRKEKKELQGKIQILKKSSGKCDKKKKKEILEEIVKLESELEAKHEEELKQLKAVVEIEDLTSEVKNVCVNGTDIEDSEETLPKDGPDFSQKVSKAQRRREKKNNQMKERNQRIAEEEAEEARTGVRALEGRAIGKILMLKNLALHQIPSDGNCLYGAIDHQLSLVGRAVGVSNLRKLTAEHLRRNQSDFLPFITPLTDSGEPVSDEQYSLYCDSVENNQEAWGGQVELQALSHVLRTPIEVLQGTGPSVILGTEYEKLSVVDGKPHVITLTYHRHAFGLGYPKTLLEKENLGTEFEEFVLILEVQKELLLFEGH